MPTRGPREALEAGPRPFSKEVAFLLGSPRRSAPGGLRWTPPGGGLDRGTGAFSEGRGGPVDHMKDSQEGPCWCSTQVLFHCEW